MSFNKHHDPCGHPNNSLGLARGIGIACLVYLLGGLAGAAWATTIAVTTTNDVVANDGLCSLREAITAVNTGAASGNLSGECAAGNGDNDTIILSAGIYLLSLMGPDEDNNATGDFDIRADVTIEGAGMTTTTIYALGIGAPDRVFDLPVTGVNVTFQDLTIENGHAPDGTASGGMFGFPTSGEDGGGIRVSSANVTLVSVTLTQNQAGAAATGGMVPGNGGHGGGIATNGGTLTISQSVFSQNVGGGSGGGGGGIYAANAIVTVDQSTMDNNNGSDTAFGGGISISFGSTIAMTNSSVTRNSSGFGGGISLFGNFQIANSTIANNSQVTAGAGVLIDRTDGQINFTTISGNTGEGINFRDNDGTNIANVKNTIVSGNSGSDCIDNSSISGTGLMSQGHNLAGSGCPSNGTGDIMTTAPMLDPLANNGGPTETMAMQTGSPAIDAADLCDANLPTTDQRGFARVFGPAPDIGAYEYGAAPSDVIFRNGFEVSVCP